MPAAAEVASAPGSPRSRTHTFNRAWARRSAIEQPMIPPPMTMTSLASVEILSSAISASLPIHSPLGYSGSTQLEAGVAPLGARASRPLFDYQLIAGEPQSNTWGPD